MNGSSIETWAPVPDYEGVYEVSDQGRVRSLDRIDSNGRTVHGKILKPWVAKRRGGGKKTTNHQIVDLNRDGRRKAVYVHTLVLTVFVGERPEGLEACHYDGDPTNNHRSNLRWDTHVGNMADLARHGRHNMTNRTKCPRRHDLREPNLVRSALLKGRRQCHACALARSYAHTHGLGVSQEVSDRYYAEILSGERA